MVLLLKVLYHGYNDYLVSNEGSTTEGYPLMKSPVLVTIILAAYLYFVKSFGPKWMEKRKPFDLRKVIIAFNLFQIVANFALAVTMYLYTYDYPEVRLNFSCVPLPTPGTDSEKAQTMFTYLYFLLKISDLLDTVFFVLRKKSNQISFLHVYHHTGMVICCWFGTKFCPGAHGTMLGFLNCWVHVFMYTYYLFTAFDPEVKKSIKWKKIITQIQLIQFGILLFHFGKAFFETSCKYPKLLSGIGISQNLVMFALFGDFYRRAYLTRKPTKKVDSTVPATPKRARG